MWIDDIAESVYRTTFDALGENITYLSLIQNADATSGNFVESTPFLAVLKRENDPNNLISSIDQMDIKCYVIANDLTAVGVTNP